MKCFAPVLCMVLLSGATTAQASIDSNARHAAPTAVPADAPSAVPAATAPAVKPAAPPPRRSAMAEAGPADRPEMRFSAMYREVGPDPSTKDRCLKSTGSRLKRDGAGNGACVIGSGQVFVPER